MRGRAAALDAGGRLLFFHGLPGIGTSSVAAKTCRDNADRFDQVIMLEMSDPTGGAVPPTGELLGRLLVALGCPEGELPASDDARQDAYRRLSRDRPIFLILRRVRFADQVRPLLPTSPDAVVVVTGSVLMRKLLMDNFQPIEVTELDPSAAREMLDGVLDSGVDEPTRDRLAQISGGHPLFIRMVGASVVAAPGRAGRLLVKFAEQGPSAFEVDGDPMVAVSFALAYESLTRAAQTAYRRLSLHPGPDFDAPAAALLLGGSADDAQDVLDMLVDRHLPKSMMDGARYRFHPLTHADASARANATDPADLRTELVRQLLTWYLRQAVSADRVLSDRWRVAPLFAEVEPMGNIAGPARGAARARALAWLGAERDTLPAAMRAAARYLPDELVWQIPIALWGMLHRHGRYAALLEFSQLGLGAAQRLGNPLAMMQLWSQLGTAQLGLGELDAAEASFRASLELAVRVGHVLGQQSALEWLGKIAARRGRPDAALDWYAQSRTYAQQLAEPVDRNRALATLDLQQARANNELADWPAAIAAARAALPVFVAAAEGDNQAKLLVEIGRAQLGGGQPGLAEASLGEALGIFAAEQTVRRQAETRELLADVARAVGDRAAERAQLHAAIELLAVVGSARQGVLRDRLTGLADG